MIARLAGRMGLWRSCRKADIVYRLAARFGYRRYLEIETGTTGNYYHLIERARFDVCRRLVYNIQPDFHDGAPIDYAVHDLDIAAALAAIAREGCRFDVILVDPYHTYDLSRRDLEAAWALLEPGGAMVVHDCLPPNEKLAQPDFRPGGWCGVTYKAYLDFVLGRPDLRYVTVDADFGCGIVRKIALAAPAPPDPPAAEIAAWRGIGRDFPAAWRYFAAHKQSLLRLIDVDTFIAGNDGLG
jgi:hypothetical protein